ncbi:hypothetical protein S1OALGB6SA_417 [Olavius algarvensis spirochete endosymbiont]|nr:MAG: hypothetical protein [Olavius algarvensis spirochete endosymbiont]VDA99349.1 hypothetical protein S1OALGB6SA_417 [Olavius algarvensis spirochete endosymbiont]
MTKQESKPSILFGGMLFPDLVFQVVLSKIVCWEFSYGW